MGGFEAAAWSTLPAVFDAAPEDVDDDSLNRGAGPLVRGSWLLARRP